MHTFVFLCCLLALLIMDQGKGVGSAECLGVMHMADTLLVITPFLFSQVPLHLTGTHLFFIFSTETIWCFCFLYVKHSSLYCYDQEPIYFKKWKLFGSDSN